MNQWIKTADQAPENNQIVIGWDNYQMKLKLRIENLKLSNLLNKEFMADTLIDERLANTLQKYQDAQLNEDPLALEKYGVGVLTQVVEIQNHLHSVGEQLNKFILTLLFHNEIDDIKDPARS